MVTYTWTCMIDFGGEVISRSGPAKEPSSLVVERNRHTFNFLGPNAFPLAFKHRIKHVSLANDALLLQGERLNLSV